MTLAEFLLARIAEDEAVARAAAVGGRWRYAGTDDIGAWTLYDKHWTIASLKTYRHDDYDYSRVLGNFRDPTDIDVDANGAHIARHDPARVLAECRAKRRIVERYQKIQSRTQDGDLDERLTLGWVLEQMAAPYADHLDYDEEWRP